MNKITLQVPEFTADGKPLLYLSQWQGFELPNGILAKGGTGVGGSTLAIDSKHPYIIAVPTTALIENKQEQHDKIYAVHSEASNHYSLADYLKNVEVPVFMVTYDSLHKLVSQLKDAGINAYQEYRLLVDEYTELLKAYNYRDKAINSLLKETILFKYVTYMSATPIPERFTPEAFKGFNYTELVWKNIIQVKPIIRKTTKPFHSVNNILKKFKANDYSLKIGENTANELFVFVNSVQTIKDIINNANLVPSEVKIICANKDSNKEILDGFSIDKPIGDNKPINFLTSKAFSGCDIHSKSGLSIIVSNVHKKNTLLDVATDIYQIAGRIRNIDNPFKSTIIHIYNTGVAEMSKIEFDEWVKEKKEETYMLIEDFNNYDERRKAAYKKSLKLGLEVNYLLYNEETNQLEYDYLKEMSEAFDFEITNNIYTNGFNVRQAYLKAGYDVESSEERVRIEEAFISTITRRSFKQEFQEYIKLRKQESKRADSLEFLNSGSLVNELDNKIAALERDYSLFKEAYAVLGAKRIETLRYNKGDITQAVYYESAEAQEAIKHTAYTIFKNGGFHSSNDIMEALQKIYDSHKIKKKVKSADILKYLPATKKQKKIDGEVITGYEINLGIKKTT